MSQNSHILVEFIPLNFKLNYLIYILNLIIQRGVGMGEVMLCEDDRRVGHDGVRGGGGAAWYGVVRGGAG